MPTPALREREGFVSTDKRSTERKQDEKIGQSGAPGSGDREAARQHHSEERRKFLKRAGVAAALAVGSSWAALAPPHWPLSLRDPDGNEGKPEQKIRRLPENGFLVEAPSTASHIGVARGENVRAMVRAAVDGIGGISHYIQKGDVVVVKPNVAFERAAPLGATTNPEVLAELVQLVREAGASKVRVADNPIEAPENCFVRSGIRAAAHESGASVYLPSPADFQTLNVPGASLIEKWPFFWRPFQGATKVIGVAPVKDHNLCGASMTTKNWYGLLGGRRNQFHQDIHTIISDLALMLRPTFVLLDGTRVMFRSGPTGGTLADVRAGHTIAASTDSLAVDAFGWEDLLRRDPYEMPDYLDQAAERGLGNPDWRSVSLKDVQVG